MRITTHILVVRETSKYRPSYKVAVVTYWLFGIVPVWQRQHYLGDD